jgi:hypothetical protein
VSFLLREDPAEIRIQALLERVAKLERALEKIAHAGNVGQTTWHETCREYEHIAEEALSE